MVKPKHREQRLTSYISGHGLTVYEAEQYHEPSQSWYIVGDSTTSEKLAKLQIELHNRNL